MDLDMYRKSVIVTGGSGGIGRSIAASFASEGARVMICGRNTDKLDESMRLLSRLSNEKHFSIAVDLEEKDGPRKIIEYALEKFGVIDVLVNNAGGTKVKGMEDNSRRSFIGSGDAEFRDVFELNFWAPCNLCRYVAPIMKENGGGSILMIASVSGKEAMNIEYDGGLVCGGFSYSVAKSANIFLSKMMSRELAKYNIRANVIAPGPICFPGSNWEKRHNKNPDATNNFISNEIPLGKFGSVEDIAELAVFLCSPKAKWITGACISVDGGQTRST